MSESGRSLCTATHMRLMTVQFRMLFLTTLHVLDKDSSINQKQRVAILMATRVRAAYVHLLEMAKDSQRALFNGRAEESGEIICLRKRTHRLTALQTTHALREPIPWPLPCVVMPQQSCCPTSRSSETPQSADCVMHPAKSHRPPS